MATIVAPVSTATVVTPPPASPGTASLTWGTTTLNFTDEDSADWTSESTVTVDSVTVHVINGGNASTLGPDGSTGAVDRTNGVQGWPAGSRAAPLLSVQLSDLIADLAAGDKVGVCVDFATPVDHSTAQDAYMAMIEADPTDAAAKGVRLRYMGNNAVDCQALNGGVASNTSTTEASDIRRMAFLVDDQTGYTSVYFTTSATDGNAPDFSDLSAWTRLDGADQSRERVTNAADYDITTDYVTAGCASDCGITITHIHGGRLTAAAS
jgi:hypothetical protein